MPATKQKTSTQKTSSQKTTAQKHSSQKSTSQKPSTQKHSNKETSNKNTQPKEIEPEKTPTEKNQTEEKQSEQQDQQDQQRDNRNFEYHPKYGTEQYVKARRPLAYITEQALRKMKYATMILLAHKFDSGNIFIRYGYFEYYDEEKKKIYFTLIHPWGTGAAGILKKDSPVSALLKEYYEYLPELDLTQSFYVNE